MERKNNYEIQAAQARALFCARDLDAVAREHGLRQEGQWLHLRLLGEPYRVSRRNGRIEREEDGRWLPADGFDETLTIFDLLCDAKPGRHAVGTWRTTLDLAARCTAGCWKTKSRMRWSCCTIRIPRACVRPAKCSAAKPSRART